MFCSSADSLYYGPYLKFCNLCGLFQSDISGSDCMASRWRIDSVTVQGFGRERSWSDIRYHPCICMEVVRITTETSVSIADIRAGKFSFSSGNYCIFNFLNCLLFYQFFLCFFCYIWKYSSGRDSTEKNNLSPISTFRCVQNICAAGCAGKVVHTRNTVLVRGYQGEWFYVWKIRPSSVQECRVLKNV